ncbi:hypothetical protein [Aureivirga sp. CE67]|uniref:hypothetical protein n=1 Tax=Aureivirga sp. CE67 TaxID=1788983 RepID=UPI0018C8D8AE|nr:hypothetical protein [Aureivirga sp. CE67]
MKKHVNGILKVLVALSVIGCSSVVKNIESTNEKDCENKKGYWYKDKCWDYTSKSIPVTYIDTYVAKSLKEIKDLSLKFNGKEIPFDNQEAIFAEGETVLIFSSFKNKGKEEMLVSTLNFNSIGKSSFKVPVKYYDQNILPLLEQEKSTEEILSHVIAEGTLKGSTKEVNGKAKIDLSGTLDGGNISYDFSYSFLEDLISMGTTTFEVKGDEAYLNGELGLKTYTQMKNLVKDHPEVKTIVLGIVPGSVNDLINVHTGRILRENKLNTKALKNSFIASGGVDLFLAGVNRTVEKGAQIGVHSWCCYEDKTARELPKDFPAHESLIDYSNYCLGKEYGEKFYFYTLEAAPFDNVHFMTEKELKEYHVATKIID